MRPWDFKYVMFQALDNKDLDSKARPGYRFDLPNLPGIDLIVARRDDPLMSSVVTAPYWDQWGYSMKRAVSTSAYVQGPATRATKQRSRSWSTIHRSRMRYGSTCFTANASQPYLLEV